MALRIAYLIDPRFSGGTSAAFAQELAVATGFARVEVHAVDSAMFRGRTVAPQIEAALDEAGLSLNWDATTITADLAVLHNPLFLKSQPVLPKRLIARHLIVVAHENFLRPGGIERFDIARCLRMIGRSSLVLRRSIAPISRHNRATVVDWLAEHDMPGWDMLEEDWFNVCAFPSLAPVARPADRRGRHSRPGFEKFPSLGDLDLCFPATAERNVILGADPFIAEGVHRPHWAMLPFRSIAVPDYLAKIDFMVYFTSPAWRESFGRVLAEAIAAGKVVISDAGTASAFDRGVIAARPGEVEAIIRRLCDQPDAYVAQVRLAQARLGAFSGDAFGAMLGRVLDADASAGGRLEAAE